MTIDALVPNLLRARACRGACVMAASIGAVLMPAGLALAGPLSASRQSTIIRFVHAGLRLEHDAHTTWVNELDADASNYDAAASFCSPGKFADSAKATAGLGRVFEADTLKVERSELPLYRFATLFKGRPKQAYHTYLNRIGSAMDRQIAVGKRVVQDARDVKAGHCTKAASELYADAHNLTSAAADAQGALGALEVFARSN